jgi:hypothetical protein
MVQVQEKTKAGKDSKVTYARPALERKEFERELKTLLTLIRDPLGAIKGRCQPDEPSPTRFIRQWASSNVN